MIKEYCFSKEWILHLRTNYPGADPTLLEKTIYAFELLAGLVGQKIDLVFKGGTCLLLLINSFRRLSIDVDIICQETADQLASKFDRLIKDTFFNRWHEDPRTPNHIPKKHFKFYFNSVINNREDYILLDVLNEQNCFSRFQRKPIELGIFETDYSTEVLLPTIDGLIGDKLTAFAPNTVGVPYRQDRSMQIIKQLFDLGELFPHFSNLEEMKFAYEALSETQNRYLKTNYSKHDTLSDTITAGFLICQLDLRGSEENENTAILRQGIRQIQSHLINYRFQLGDAKIAAARTVLLTQILRTNSVPSPYQLRFDESKIDQIRDISLSGNLHLLNRLKAVAPESFYYWHLFSILSE